MKYRSILLFGAPGAGKGTQGKILGSIPQFLHCSCGDVFRNLRPESPLGKLFLQYSSRGQLVPDEPTIKLWKESIKNQHRGQRYHPQHDYAGARRHSLQRGTRRKSCGTLWTLSVVFYLQSSR